MRVPYAKASGARALAILKAAGIELDGLRSATIQIHVGELVIYEVKRFAYEVDTEQGCASIVGDAPDL